MKLLGRESGHLVVVGHNGKIARHFEAEFGGGTQHTKRHQDGAAQDGCRPVVAL